MSEKKLEQIKALLRKAESTNSLHEAEAIHAKVTELMFKYSIDEASLADSEKAKDEFEIRHYFFAGSRANVNLKGMSWIGSSSFGDAVKFLYDPTMTRDWRKISPSKDKRKGLYLTAYGFTNELDQFEMLKSSLLIASNRALAKWTRSKEIDEAIETEMYYNGIQYQSAKNKVQKSWLAGYYHSVSVKIGAARRKIAQDTPPEYGLVLVSKEDKVKQYMDKLSTRSGRSQNYGSGFSAGYKAGSSYNTSSTLGGGRRSLTS